MRPTEHGWPIVYGFPTVNGVRIHVRGSHRVVITKELYEYFHAFRMHRTAMKLPLSDYVIHRIRTELDMNYVQDRRRWWRQIELEATNESRRTEEAIGKPHKVWSKEEIFHFTECIKAGEHVADIAAKMGKPFRAADNLRRRLFGLLRPQQAWSQKDKDRLCELAAQGLTAKEIAAIMGRTTKKVQHKLVALRKYVSSKKGFWTAEEFQRFKEFAAEGKSASEIAQEINRPVSTVKQKWSQVVGLKRPNK